MLPNDRIFLVDGETILKGSRLTAIAVRERRDMNVSRRDRVQLDRREKRVIGGALLYLHHLPETKRKKDPSDRIFWVDGGTESRKNAHSIISDKQNGILLPSRFAAIRLSAIWKTIG